MARLFEPLFVVLARARVLGSPRTRVATIVAFVLITFLHVILGELAPKAVALQRPDTVSLWVARPLLWFSRVMRPFIVLMNGAGNGVVRLFGFEPISGHEMAHSMEEVAMIIEESRQAGVLPRDQAEYVHNVFRLPAKRVRDCLVPLRQDGRARTAYARAADPRAGARGGPYADARL